MVLPVKTKKEKPAHHHFRSDVTALSEVLSTPSLCRKRGRRPRSSQARGSGEPQLQGHHGGVSHAMPPPLLLVPTASTMHRLTQLGKEPRSRLRLRHGPVNGGVPSRQPARPEQGVGFSKKTRDSSFPIDGETESLSHFCAGRGGDGLRQPVPKCSRAFPPGPTRPFK